eukprot:TRINITY_DN1646_c0_g1_i3.p1 TRINITY_DN1646_c0_g1~~TRINITY_DN1646_c0_g1_i3.p1  ORF type:complete len:402 (+),score=92.01 TRINITY_DN1646_c0_g1_i3:222-1427(+)
MDRGHNSVVDMSYSPAIQSLWVKVAPELDLSNESISFISSMCSNVLNAILRYNQENLITEDALSVENIQRTLNKILSPEMAKDVLSGKINVGSSERDLGRGESLNEFEIIDDDNLSYESTPVVPQTKPSIGQGSLVFSPDLVVQKVFALGGGTIEKSSALYIASVLEYIVAKLLGVVMNKRGGSTREEVTAAEFEVVIKEDPKLGWLSSLLFQSPSESNTPSPLSSSPLSSPPPSPRRESPVVNNSPTLSSDSPVHQTLPLQTTTTDTETSNTQSDEDSTPEKIENKVKQIDTLQQTSSPSIPTQQQPHTLAENSFKENVSPQRSSPLPRPRSPNSTIHYNYHSFSTFELMVMSNPHRVMAKDKIYPLSIIKETPLQFDNQLLIIFVFLGCLTLNTVFSSS